MNNTLGKKRGKLITFSGIDGSGKSTLCKMAFDYYKNVYPCRLLSGVEKRIFTDELENIASSLGQNKDILFDGYINNIAWMCDFINTSNSIIKPLIDRGVNIFLDRYYLCAKVYSTALTEMHIDNLFDVYSTFVKPDMCFYLSLDAAEAEKRIEHRNRERVFYETQKYLGKIKDVYEKLISHEDYPISVIDATYPLDSSLDIIKSIINPIIEK